MKLNVIAILNQIAFEEASVEPEFVNPFEGKEELDWYDELRKEQWEKAQEERRQALERWAHVTDVETYYDEWCEEMNWRESYNEQSFELCDYLLKYGESIDHVHFEEIIPFDEWIVKELETISEYLVAA